MVMTVVRLSAVLSMLLVLVRGHGRMLNPPSRSSMWRAGFKTPRNYNDNGLNCGGFVMQFHKNNGQCGVCGDPYQGPRDNEAGGKYALGVIGQVYSPGQTINVTLEITSNHGGYFEFRLCPQNNPYVSITERCLDQFILDIVGFGKRYNIYSRDSNLWVYLELALPRSVTCKQCVLQWKWVAAQNRGSDGKGGECFGCCPQEHFINCADIAVGKDWITPIPSHSGIVTTTSTYHARGKGQGQVQIHRSQDQRFRQPTNYHERFAQTKANLDPHIQSSTLATNDWPGWKKHSKPNIGNPRNIPTSLSGNKMQHHEQEAEAEGEQQEFLSGLPYSDMTLLRNLLNPASGPSAALTCSHLSSHPVCEALPSLVEVGTFNEFCSSMCPIGTCPKSICKCTCIHENW